MEQQWLPVDAPDGTEIDFFELLIAVIDGFLNREISATDLLLICVRCIPPGDDFLSEMSALWSMTAMHVAMYLAGNWQREALADSLAQISREMGAGRLPGRTVMFGSPEWKEVLARDQAPWPMRSAIWPKPPAVSGAGNQT